MATNYLDPPGRYSWERHPCCHFQDHAEQVYLCRSYKFSRKQSSGEFQLQSSDRSLLHFKSWFPNRRIHRGSTRRSTIQEYCTHRFRVGTIGFLSVPRRKYVRRIHQIAFSAISKRSSNDDRQYHTIYRQYRWKHYFLGNHVVSRSVLS